MARRGRRGRSPGGWSAASFRPQRGCSVTMKRTAWSPPPATAPPPSIPGAFFPGRSQQQRHVADRASGGGGLRRRRNSATFSLARYKHNTATHPSSPQGGGKGAAQSPQSRYKSPNWRSSTTAGNSEERPLTSPLSRPGPAASASLAAPHRDKQKPLAPCPEPSHFLRAPARRHTDLPPAVASPFSHPLV